MEALSHLASWVDTSCAGLRGEAPSQAYYTAVSSAVALVLKPDSCALPTHLKSLTVREAGAFPFLALRMA
jgi:hypothetical protein